MDSRTDPLLLELFEALHNELAIALEAQHRQLDAASASVDMTLEQTQRIGWLRSAIAAVEGALDRRESGIIH